MKLLFWKNKVENEKLDALEHEAATVHQKKLAEIDETQQKVDKLNLVLTQNNIVFQLAHVTGNHK